MCDSVKRGGRGQADKLETELWACGERALLEEGPLRKGTLLPQ